MSNTSENEFDVHEFQKSLRRLAIMFAEEELPALRELLGPDWDTFHQRLQYWLVQIEEASTEEEWSIAVDGLYDLFLEDAVARGAFADYVFAVQPAFRPFVAARPYGSGGIAIELDFDEALGPPEPELWTEEVGEAAEAEPPPRMEPEAAPPMAPEAASPPRPQPPSPVPRKPEAEGARRVPAFKFFHCGNSRDCDDPQPWSNRALQAKHWYRLDVAIKLDVEEGDVQPVDRERDAVSLPGEVPEGATLFICVSEEYGLFEFANQTASLKLTPGGTSKGSAQFRLSPRDANDRPVPLIVRLYYKNNLLQRLSILVEVVDTWAEVDEDPDAQRYKLEEVRDLAGIPTPSPVKIHLDIDQSEQRSGTYTLAVTVGEVELFGTGQFIAKDFEKWINQARDAIYRVSSDYVELRKAIDQGETAKTTTLHYEHIKALAKAGRDMWTGVFNNPNSPDLKAISDWWRQNRPEAGSVVQIDLRGALDFVVPWGVMFDSRLRPTIDAELEKITPEDFWGMRYQIEHNTHGAPNAAPPVYSTDDCLPLAMMIGAKPIGEKHFKQIQSIAERTDRLAVYGPIEKPSEARALFNMDASPTSGSWPLVYFIGHAYTRKATALAIRDGLDMFCKWYNEKPDDAKRMRYAQTAKVFCTEEFGGKYSFFQLTGGSVRHEDELDVDRVNLQDTRPFIFFNACQSAQNSPSPTEGWVHLLISQGAGGYLGTEVFIDAQFAQAFGTAFWEAFLSGMTVGEAVLAVRRRFAEQKMLQGLAYTHYGPAGVRLKEGLLSGGDGESDR